MFDWQWREGWWPEESYDEQGLKEGQNEGSAGWSWRVHDWQWCEGSWPEESYDEQGLKEGHNEGRTGWHWRVKKDCNSTSPPEAERTDGQWSEGLKEGQNPARSPKAQTEPSKKWKALKLGLQTAQQELKALELEREGIRQQRAAFKKACKETDEGLEESHIRSENPTAEAAVQSYQLQGVWGTTPWAAEASAGSQLSGLEESHAAASVSFPAWENQPQRLVPLESWCQGDACTLCRKPLNHQHLMSEGHVRRMDRLMRRFGYRGF